MAMHKEWWEWIGLALGYTGGIKTISDLVQTWVFSTPKLTGEVLYKRWEAKISDALKGNMDRSLLIFMSVSNQHAQKTSVRNWVIELTLADKSRKTIECSECGVGFWDDHRIEHQPTDKRPLDIDVVFEQNEIHKGWLRFLVSIDLEPQSFAVSAIDARGKKHTVTRSPVPAE